MKAQRIMRNVVGVLALLLFGLAQPVRAELAAVGPVDPVNGFPTWYQDIPGTKLELCLDGDGATGPCIFDPVDPANQFSVQTGFGAEAFYWYADATMLGAGAVDALMVTALEAAYAAGDPAAGDQITFARVRIRVAGLPVNGLYTVIHPFGSFDFNVVVDPLGKRDINFTSDIGIGPFSGALRGAIGPYLRWSGPDVLNPAAPYVPVLGGPAYLGNPLVPHTVTGSPFGTNFFMIVGPRGAVLNPVNGSNVLSTNLFTLAGKIATRAGVTVDRAAYQRDGLGGNFIDVFASSLPGQIIQVSGVGPTPVSMREQPGAGRYYARIAFVGNPPATIAVKNISDPVPQTAVTVAVTDTVWALNFYDLASQTLIFTALSSDLGVPQIFTAVDAPLFLGPGVIAPPAFVTQTSAPGGGSDTEPVIVTTINRAPVIVSTPGTAAVALEPFSYQVVATDDPGSVLAYALTTAPLGMTISSAGLISWVPPTAPLFPYDAPVTLTVTDQGGLFATQPFTITVAENLPPAFTSVPVLTGVGNQPYSYQAAATDPNGGTLTYSLDAAPLGMTISAGGLVAWTPTAVGSFPVTVRVTDVGGLFATQIFSVAVAVVNVAPVITSTPVTAGLPGAAYTYALLATDTVGDALTYSLDIAPLGMTISAAGVVSFTPTAGNFPVTARVTDQGGLFATQSFVLVVAFPNTAPVITSTPTTVALLNRIYSFQMTATDSPGSILRFSLDVAPAGMTITAGGFISWLPTVATAAAVTVRVTDQGGLFATRSFTIVARQQELLKVTRADYFRALARWAITGTDNLPGNLITLRAGTATGPIITTVPVLANGTFSFVGAGLTLRGTATKVTAVSQTGVSVTVSLGLR